MSRFVLSVVLIFATIVAAAQNTAPVEQQIEGLRSQLRDVTDKEAALQERKQKLEEDLKPENIEHSVATIGTTDARELREQRQQQLEREKATVESQLTSLAESRNRLESSIASAEAEVVRLKANALGTNNASTTTTTTPVAATTTTTAEKPSVKSGSRRSTQKRLRRGRARRRAAH